MTNSKNNTIEDIIESSRERGWILEPLCQEILKEFHLASESFRWIKEKGAIEESAVSFPCAAKVVSPAILHKSDHDGVLLNIATRDELSQAFEKLESLPDFKGIAVDTMAEGMELIIGAKDDQQFGTVVLFGIGGTAVEIYRDVSILMAPASEKDIHRALKGLKGISLLEGFRGRGEVDLQELSRFIARFSHMAYQLRHDITSIDLNPVICSGKNIHVADARFMVENVSSQENI